MGEVYERCDGKRALQSKTSKIVAAESIRRMKTRSATLSAHVEMMEKERVEESTRVKDLSDKMQKTMQDMEATWEEKAKQWGAKREQELLEEWNRRAAERERQLQEKWNRWAEDKEREFVEQSHRRVRERVEEVRQEMLRQQGENMEDQRDIGRFEAQDIRMKEMEAEVAKMKDAQVSSFTQTPSHPT